MENNSKHTTKDWLSKLSNNDGFDTPKDYFDEIEDHFSIKLIEETFPDKNGFETPKSYFDNLENSILSKVEIPKQAKVISMRNNVIRWSAIAASIAIIFVTTFALINNNEPTSDEMFAWLEDNIDSISTTELAYQFESSIDIEETELFTTEIDNNQLEYYLDENDTYILIENSNIPLDEIN